MGAAPSTRPSISSWELADRWAEKFQAERFDVLVSGPFVIAGDGGEERLAQYRDRTILAAQRALNATFFTTPPSRPVLILLFEDDKTYRRLAKAWFEDTDVPHFGYFRSDNVMLMNVGTGTGTLVHELAHALIKPDFPTIPSWANEGLASLYEQCNINGTTIKGLVNWRLPALKRAISQKKLRTFNELLADDDFYDEDHVGLNYAQARYLMMYLQDQGKLAAFYKDFRDHAAEDPTGQRALERTIAPMKLDEFEAKWRAWVLRL
jgi:hypothetical protein